MSVSSAASRKITEYLPIFKSLFDLHNEGVLIATIDDFIIYYNQAQSRLDGIPQEKALGRKICDVYNITEECSPTIQVLRTGKATCDDVHFYRTYHGRLVNSSCCIYPIVIDEILCGALSFIKEYSFMQLEALEALQQTEKIPLMALSGSSHNSSNIKERIRPRKAYTFANLVGNEPKLLVMATAAKQAANTPSPILLCGETGVGKEFFARSIHEYSHRAKQPYTAINCSAVPETLLEGILFGTTKGAFTGAVDKAGLFESTDGGTLFLDEIDSMPLGLQSKLLRVLQEMRIRRVGELHERPINVKLISSIGRPPQEALQQGLLRKDFYFRVGVVQLLIPPLRERMNDLPLLVKHFIAKHCALLHIAEPLISPEVMDAFYRYTWPGNVRELEHCIEACLNILDKSSSIDIRQIQCVYPNLFELAAKLENPVSTLPTNENSIPITVRGSSILPTQKIPGRPGMLSPAHPQNGRMMVPESYLSLPSPYLHSPSVTTTLAEKKELLERETICQALQRTAGAKNNAARLLGISQQLLHHKLKKYKIDARLFLPTQLQGH